jgi:hypothetical protein
MGVQKLPKLYKGKNGVIKKVPIGTFNQVLSHREI